MTKMKRSIAAVLMLAILFSASFALARVREETLVILVDEWGYTAVEMEKDFLPDYAQNGLDYIKGRYATAEEAFILAHPGLSILFTDTLIHSSTDNINEVLASGSTEVDIICTQDADLWALYEQGFLVDLYQSPAIREALADWQDLRPLLGDSEHLFAVPQSLTPTLVQLVSPAILQELVITIDEGSWESWSWEDFFDMGDTVRAYNAEKGTDYYFACSKLWNPVWLDQWVMGERAQTPDTPVDKEQLSGLLSRWKGFLDDDLIINPIAFSQQTGAQDNTLFDLYPRSYADLRGSAVYPLPLYRSGALRSGVDALVFVVNAASPKLEAAVDFLVAYCHPDAIGMSVDYWGNGLVLESARSGDMWWDGTRDTPDLPPCPDIEALWWESITTGFMNRYSPALITAYAQMRGYLAGEITLEACTAAIEAAVLKDRDD